MVITVIPMTAQAFTRAHMEKQLSKAVPEP